MTDINRISVLGAGTMGHGIAHAAIAAGYETYLFDVSSRALDAGRTAIETIVRKGVELGKVASADAGSMLQRLKASNDLAAALAEAAGARAEAAWHELLPTGLRLLLFAEAHPPGGDGATPFQGSLEGFVLRPLALVALSDELRPEAGAVLEALAAQGIAFKILSGDNPETVRATVAHINLPLAQEAVVSGDELASAKDRAEVIGEPHLAIDGQRMQVADTDFGPGLGDCGSAERRDCSGSTATVQQRPAM